MAVTWAISRVMAGVKGGIVRGFAAWLVPHVTCKHVRVICAARQLRLASLPRRHLGTCDGKCCGTRSGSMLAVSGEQSAQVHAYRSVASPSQRAERRVQLRGLGLRNDHDACCKEAMAALTSADLMKVAQQHLQSPCLSLCGPAERLTQLERVWSSI